MDTSRQSKPGAFPSEVTAYEELVYRVSIGHRVDTSLVSASGVIQVKVPFDGTKFLNMAKLRETIKANNALGEILIGHIGLSQYGRTALSTSTPTLKDWDQPVKVSIYLPIQDVDRRVSLGSDYVSSLKYQIIEPSEVPVMIDAVLTDDAEVKDWTDIPTSFQERLQLRFHIRSDVGNISQTVKELLIEKVRKAKEESQKKLSEIQQKIASTGEKLSDDLVHERASAEDKHSRLSQILSDLEALSREKVERFTAEEVSRLITATIEKNAEKLTNNTRQQLEELQDFVWKHLGGIELSYLGIEYPYAGHSSESSKWIYNPETGCMEIRRLNLEWNRDERLYEAIIYLNLYRPTERFPTIHGRLVLETDKLLSGMKVEWLDVNSVADAKVPIISKTSIVVEIEAIDLPRIFQRKQFFSRREMVFKSVLPLPQRLRDVENILNDIGLTIVRRSYESTAGQKDLTDGCLITATRKSIGEPMRIWVRLSGSLKTGTHRIEYDGKQQELEESVPTGDLRIDLYGLGIGNSHEVNYILNDIQALLETRMSPLKTLQP